LVVICFPGLDEPKCEDWSGESPSEDEAQGCKISNGDEETPPTLNPSDSGDTEAGEHVFFVWDSLVNMIV